MGVIFDPILGQLRLSDGGGSGTVDSIQPGLNIQVDATDPANPTVGTTSALANIDNIEGVTDNGGLIIRAGQVSTPDTLGTSLQLYAHEGTGNADGGQAALVAGGTGMTGGKGGLVNLQAGHAQGGSNGDGGDILLYPGMPEGTGIAGHVHIGQYSGTDIILDNYSVTADRTYTFPDQSGTFALLTDITGGGISRSISSISSPTTAGAAAATDYVYLVSGTTTLTLPTAVGNTNRYTVKNTGSNTVTIATTSAQTIDGSSTASLTPNTSLDLISDNSNWSVV